MAARTRNAWVTATTSTREPYQRGYGRSLLVDRQCRKEETVRTLANHLVTDEQTTSLSMKWNELWPEDIRHLSIAFRTNTTLTHIDLSHNDIRSEGCEILASGLRCNFTVQTIGLADNNITDVGGHALLDLLHYNSSLKEIDLSFNRMSDGVLVQIEDALLSSDFSPKKPAFRRETAKESSEEKRGKKLSADDAVRLQTQLELETQSHNASKKMLDKEKRAYRKLMSKYNKERSTSEKEKQKLRGEIANKSSKLAVLQRNNMNLQRSNKNLQSKIDPLKQEVERLTMELKMEKESKKELLTEMKVLHCQTTAVKFAEKLESVSCRICDERPMEMVNVPCGHLVACGVCSSRLSVCPLCRKQIHSIVRVFMS